MKNKKFAKKFRLKKRKRTKTMKVIMVLIIDKELQFIHLEKLS